MEQATQGATTRSWKLANGLQIELGVHDLRQADLAVCSTDKDGNEGALNREVLAQAGIAVKLSSMFRAPVTRLEGKPAVLVVQTVEYGKPTGELLENNLRAGLRQIGSAQTLWLPLLGTGSGGLSPHRQRADDAARAR